MYYAWTVGNYMKPIHYLFIVPCKGAWFWNGKLFPSSHHPPIHPVNYNSALLNSPGVLEPLTVEVSSRNTPWMCYPSICPHIHTNGQITIASEPNWMLRWNQRKLKQACLMFLITCNTFCSPIYVRHLFPFAIFLFLLKKKKKTVQIRYFFYF